MKRIVERLLWVMFLVLFTATGFVYGRLSVVIACQAKGETGMVAGKHYRCSVVEEPGAQ